MGADAMLIEDLQFVSGDVECAATLYRPEPDRSTGQPCVVLANGVSLTRRDGVPRFAKRFVDAGFAALTFDFRHLGDSAGDPRQLIDVHQQSADFAAAVAFARSLEGIDPGRIVAWGYSLGGGLTVELAARDDELGAAIALCPMVDGFAFTRAAGFRSNLHMLLGAARAMAGRRTLQMPAVGPPGSRALLTQPEAEPDFQELRGADSRWRNEVRAKPSQPAALFRPVRAAGDVRCPLLLCLGDDDTMVPPRPIERAASRAPHGELRRYPVNHAGGFLEGFGPVVADQIEFLDRSLAPRAA